MKKLLVLIASFIIFSPLVAQVAPSGYTPQEHLYVKKVISYDKMKRGGIGLAIGGTIMTGIGSLLLVDYVNKSVNEYYNDFYDVYTDEQLEFQLLMGIAATSLGITAMGGGITLWVIGSAKSRSYTNKLNSLSFNLSPGYKQQFSLAYRF
jgi:hypothetical protein